MRVLYLINYAGKAGTEKYVENLVRILGEGLIEPYFAYNIAGELSEKMAAAGVPCLQLDMGKSRVASAAKALASYCRENEIEVIHAQYPRENLVAILSKKHYDKPRVVMTNHLTLNPEGMSGAVWKHLNRRYTKQNHRIIAVCDEGRDIMLRNGVAPDKVKVIYNGIEPSPTQPRNEAKRRELGLSENCFVFTILARFAPEKGLSFLMDTLRLLKRESEREFCCLVCGDGELFGEIDAKRKELGLEDCCKLLGYRNDVREILQASDAYICTSSRNEAMSFAILEAMDCGLPLVVTDVGGNATLAKGLGLTCGFVEKFDKPMNFANKLLIFMEDESLRDEFSENAKEKVEKFFNLNKLARDVYEAYR